MKDIKLNLLGFFVVLMFIILLANNCFAASVEWPTEAITMIVPMKPGGGVDSMARGLAKYWSKHLGVPIVVENHSGGAGMVGLEYFKAQPDDGQYIFIFHQTKFSAGYVLLGRDYSIEDFAIINAQEMDPATVVVPKDSKYQTFKELIDDIKAHPGEISMGTMISTGTHLGALVLIDELGLDVRQVTYSGGNEFRLALIGGHVDYGQGNAVADYAFKDDLRELAVYTDETFSLYPDALPINQALEPYGVTVPTGLGSLRNVLTHASFKEKYPERYQVLVDSYKKTLEDPEYKKYLEEVGASNVTSYRGEEKSYEMNKNFEKLMIKYKDLFSL